MSISDLIVVMKSGLVQQIGKPQDVYDNPANLFVARFLGTPPINVFNGRVQAGKVYIGDAAVLEAAGVPEGFNVAEDGPLVCQLRDIEVMGHATSFLSSHEASINPVIRTLKDADRHITVEGDTIRYSLKPHKTFLFRHDDAAERIECEVK